MDELTASGDLSRMLGMAGLLTSIGTGPTSTGYDRCHESSTNRWPQYSGGRADRNLHCFLPGQCHGVAQDNSSSGRHLRWSQL